MTPGAISECLPEWELKVTRCLQVILHGDLRRSRRQHVLRNQPCTLRVVREVVDQHSVEVERVEEIERDERALTSEAHHLTDPEVEDVDPIAPHLVGCQQVHSEVGRAAGQITPSHCRTTALGMIQFASSGTPGLLVSVKATCTSSLGTICEPAEVNRVVMPGAM